MNWFRTRRPSAALVVSIVALVVAMAGTGYAALSVPPNSVGSKQLKKGAVTTAKLKNGAVTGAKIKLSTVGTVPSAHHANTATSATNAINATNATNAQPAAFAHASATGVLDTGRSKNVTKVTVNNTAVGLYCISGIPFTPKGGQATVDGTTGGAQDGAQVDLGTTTGCPSGTQAMVYTYSGMFGGTPDPFFVIFYA